MGMGLDVKGCRERQELDQARQLASAILARLPTQSSQNQLSGSLGNTRGLTWFTPSQFLQVSLLVRWPQRWIQLPMSNRACVHSTFFVNSTCDYNGFALAIIPLHCL